MTIGELVFWYSSIFFILLLALIVLLLQRKTKGKRIFTGTDWRSLFDSFKEKALRGEFWLKILIAAVISLSAGLMIVIFVLPYGTTLALAVLAPTVLALILVLPKLLT
jgi:uncharacterized membrane protein YhaH (DUF805 family)